MTYAEYKSNLPSRTAQDEDPVIADLITRVTGKSGAVSALYAQMANAPGLLEAYTSGYRSFAKESGFTPAEQQLIMLEISRFNGCTYCTWAHSAGARSAQVPEETIAAVMDQRQLDDVRLQSLVSFVRTMVATRGLPTSEDSRRFLDAGYTEQQVLYIILAISMKTITNYTSHIFHTQPSA
ncbi:MAG: carboxymuconolactone decarboxylase family protein [Candidatus Nanopelagicales bacterium]|nr:carboxymuconolactone decarboxylase family protein [Candidatus Nanopelagicales bacterium]